MYIDVMCSCCGNHQKLSNKRIQDTADLIHSGWGSCGSALYCPECTKSWKERNGSRPMGDERNTFLVVMNLFYDAKRAETPPTTNADMLRAMSDEELAEWIETIADCRMCKIDEKHCSCGELNTRASCMIHWLYWLRQEAPHD